MKSTRQNMKYLMAVIVGYALCTLTGMIMQGNQLNQETLEVAKCPSCKCMNKDMKDSVISEKPLRPTSMYDVLGYDYFNKTKVFNSYYGEAGHGLLHHEKEELKALTKEILKYHAQHSRNNATWKLRDIVNGYRRVDPLQGIDYILDLELYSKQYNKKQIRVELVKPLHKVKFLSQEIIPDPQQSTKIHFILPVSSVGERFHRFIQLYEEICLKSSDVNVAMVIVLFINGKDKNTVETATKVKGTISDLKERYKKADLSIIEHFGIFSRGYGMDIGTRSLPPKALMYFCDVDVTFTLEFLTRCRLNAVQDKQVYYPIVFSQYHPAIVKSYTPREKSTGMEHITKYTGHFVYYAYGMVCLYKSDYTAVGGFNLSRQGWGGEDVELFTKHAKSQLNVIRAADPGLIHIFHPKFCDKSLTANQYQMCIQSAAEALGSRQQLGLLVLNRFNGSVPNT